MSAGPLHVTRNGPILEVVLDRPKANAIDASTSRVMSEAFVKFRDDPELRVAIITGGGEKFFCAGWDLKAAAAGEAPDEDYGPGGFGGRAMTRPTSTGLGIPVCPPAMASIFAITSGRKGTVRPLFMS